jgi:ParB family chromosome partitioning protein
VAEKKRLGRGLSALIGERAAAGAGDARGGAGRGAGDATPGTTPGEAFGGAAAAAPGSAATDVGAAGEGRLRDLPVADIVASSRQPRRSFDDEELHELAESIRTLGVVQPVVVRPGKPGAEAPWELIAGERRLRASRIAGLETVPALVRSADEAAALEIALAENVAREDLNAIEEAHAYAALVDEFGLTHERIGELVGRSRVAVTNVLRLLELPDEVRLMIETGELTEGHARAILTVPDHGARRKTARAVVREGLTVRQTEALARKVNDAAAQTGAGGGVVAPSRRESAYDDLVDELYGLLELPVRIHAGKRGGRVEVRFKDGAELDRLLELLRRLGGESS